MITKKLAHRERAILILVHIWNAEVKTLSAANKESIFLEKNNMNFVKNPNIKKRMTIACHFKDQGQVQHTLLHS